MMSILENQRQKRMRRSLEKMANFFLEAERIGASKVLIFPDDALKSLYQVEEEVSNSILILREKPSPIIFRFTVCININKMVGLILKFY
jgi:hypothetical protein